MRQSTKACPTCGKLLDADAYCPVCLFRAALETDDPVAAAEDPKLTSAGLRFGHYEVVVGDDGRPLELGSGAMGITYKAIDVELHCPVTLKVISGRYVKDESARARFVREARAAAAVRNANVASVFHLGKTGDNYFYAMEFVPGETLEKILSQSGRLSAQDALEILSHVANGLSAIQRNNLIHRDLKPSNIMVNREGAKIESVKIIDLGLAKSLDERESRALSIPGSFAGTPAYASPEQFSGVGVDIRSDLYSLGITLWEMLTGELPFKGSGSELVYKHQHADLPFAALSEVPQPVEALLEVLLEKNPAARFQTPAELIKAIKIVNEAVESGRRVSKTNLRSTVEWPAPVRGAGGKWRPFRRIARSKAVSKWLIAVGLVTVLAMGGGLVLWITGRQNEQSRQLAEIREAMGQMITQFPQKEADQRQAQGKVNPDSARARVIEELSKQYGLDPTLVEKQLPQFADQLKRAPNSTTYERASAAYVAKDYNETERLALVAADEAQRASPPKNVDAIKAFELAAWAAESRIEYADALKRLREAEQLTDRTRDAKEWSRVQFAIAWILQDQGKYRDAEVAFRDVLTVREEALGPEHPDTLATRERLARALAFEGKYAEAEAEYRAVIQLRQKILGSEHPDALTPRNSLGNVLRLEGKYAEAEKEYRDVMKLREKVLAPDDPNTLATRKNLANVLYDQGKYTEAEAEDRAVIKGEAKVLGPEHPTTLQTRNNLANLLDHEGRYAEAEAEYRAVINLQERVLGPEHPNTLFVRSNLAKALDHEGKYGEAEAEDREVIRLKEKVLGPENPDTLETRSNLVEALDHEGKYDEAETEGRTVTQIREKLLGPGNRDTLLAHNSLAKVLEHEGKYADAEAEDQAVLQLRQQVLGPEHPDTLLTRSQRASVLDEQGKSAEAEVEDRAVLLLQEKVAGPEDPSTLQTRDNLATTLEHQGKDEEAETEYRTVLKLREKVLGLEHPDTLETCFNLAQCLRAQNKTQEASALARRAAQGTRQILGANHPLTKKCEELVGELTQSRRD
ncbi:MAG: tetratricopeptide repeat protein [Verrucomicrobia bacterium]|nr:tetratricopeptide repeat protein [Verrucomicrobiota bacterium]